MSLTDHRKVYRPFVYPQAFEFFKNAQMSHWLPTEVTMAGDKKDYEENLTASEKEVIIKILRLFTVIELDAEDYWLKIAEWFPHPEIQQMAATNAGMESVHIWGYDYLSQSLDLPLSEYKEFLKDTAMNNKKKAVGEILKQTTTLEDKALAIAVFSGFLEGVALFSSFAALLSFSRFNKLKGVANIVAWSIRDESLHSESGCWLFRQLIIENPQIINDQFKKKIYQAARDVVELEDIFVDRVFSGGHIESIDPKDLKAFIRFRANLKLNDLGLKKNWKNIDMEAVDRINSWFEILAAGNEHTDFFSSRSTAYAKGHIDWFSITF